MSFGSYFTGGGGVVHDARLMDSWLQVKLGHT